MNPTQTEETRPDCICKPGFFATDCPIHGIPKSIPTSEGWVNLEKPNPSSASDPLSFVDTFHGDNMHILRSNRALLDLDSENALAPHGMGGHAHGLLESTSARLVKLTAETTALQKLVAEMREALENLLTLSENADETGYVDGEGWLPLEEIQQAARKALSLTPAGIADQWVRKSEVEQENKDLREKLANAEKERDDLSEQARKIRIDVQAGNRDLADEVGKYVLNHFQAMRDLTAARQSASEAEGLRESVLATKKVCPKCKGRKGFDDTTYDRTGIWTVCGACDGTGEVFDIPALRKALQPAKGEAKSVQASAKITIGPDDNCSGYFENV